VLVPTQVALMDADVMITVVLSIEVFLFALAATLFIAHQAREGGSKTGQQAGMSAPRRPARV
jgi:hypothetical protein